MVTSAPHGFKSRVWKRIFELGFGGDVVAGEGNGRGREVAGGANVVLVDGRLESVPAREGRTRRREEETGAVEVIGLENTNGLKNVTTARGGVDGGGGS